MISRGNCKEWFAEKGRGLNVNDAAFGRWVEGGPTGSHQKWSWQFNQEWRKFIQGNPNADRDQTLRFMNRMRNDPRFQ